MRGPETSATLDTAGQEAANTGLLVARLHMPAADPTSHALMLLEYMYLLRSYITLLLVV
eukprot:COSAG01_NODE_44865_length_414_cov_9.955556_1_plen_59_part_00